MMSRKIKRYNRRSQQGSVMVQALIVLAGLVALMAVLAQNQHAALDAAQTRMRQRRAEMAARSAVARAMAVLQTATTSKVTLQDDWAQLGDNGNMTFDMGDNTSTFRMQIIDGGSLINVNTITQAQLQLLPITQEQQDSLLDWRSAGETPRANGAKDDYYNGLTIPYNAKLGRINSINDLLLIKDWTAADLLYPQTDVQSSAGPLEDSNGNTLPLIDVLTADSGAPNQQGTGGARINLSRRTNATTFERLGASGTLAAALAAAGPYTSFSTLFRQPGMTPTLEQRLLNSATFTNATRVEGKINLNTASLAVLQTVPNVTPDIAQSIVEKQATGFTSLGDLTTVAGLTGARLGNVADAFTVGSDTWIVRAYGESGGTGVAMEVVVGIRNNQPQVLTWNRLPNTSVPAWWAWPTSPTETADAGDTITSSNSPTTSGGNP